MSKVGNTTTSHSMNLDKHLYIWNSPCFSACKLRKITIILMTSIETTYNYCLVPLGQDFFVPSLSHLSDGRILMASVSKCCHQ